jgi:hypothetical protein
MPDREYVLEQYETLRVEALTAAARGHGLSLLLRRGLTGWLRALSALGPAPPTRLRASEPGAARPQLAPAGRVELTTVLAGMVLACVEATEGRA